MIWCFGCLSEAPFFTIFSSKSMTRDISLTRPQHGDIYSKIVFRGCTTQIPIQHQSLQFNYCIIFNDFGILRYTDIPPKENHYIIITWREEGLGPFRG